MRAANAKQYDCVHQKDKTTNPKQVKRCESCKFQFNNSDVVLECAVANCSETDKKDNKHNTSGNVYQQLTNFLLSLNIFLADKGLKQLCLHQNASFTTSLFILFLLGLSLVKL